MRFLTLFRFRPRSSRHSLIRSRTKIFDMASAYDNWTREDLIKHIAHLESKSSNPLVDPQVIEKSRKDSRKDFDFSSYPKRKIALKFCYSGWEYNGLAYQTLPTPLPTVESVLFDALAMAKLVDPEASFEGCGWEKCGRTDRGVSAAGQVVSLWVRSTLVNQEAESLRLPSESADQIREADLALAHEELGSLDITPATSTPVSKPKGSYKPEHDYVTILNRILPPTIRVFAWSPVSPNFSARFSCRYRHYKYFFSSQGLNIDLMRTGASRLVGEHDFRNLCKLDPAKQITMFKRKIISVDITPVDANIPEIYVLDLVGSAFLYHQVRHIMAILFHVGAGLERPSVITSLLNVADDAEHVVDEMDPPLQVVDRRPEYQMADALPLMLWDCAYKPEDVDWQIDGHTDAQKRQESLENNTGGMYSALQSTLERSKIFSTLNQHFLSAAALYHPRPVQVFPLTYPPVSTKPTKQPMQIPLGGGTYKRVTRYTPLLDRVRMDPVEVVNERWRNGKGLRREERRKAEAIADEDE
ncbi:pseudouridine synthase [Amanita rubescens]|nr:pseudouridine synthase [Amanita rubescens]